ncbi:ankyrin repeat domain-containing protein [Cupriavidus nantongensis]|uniref:ankyrin repeat domain-containing protein n=1 Tax=Cupriavidus nantongensis TaxID=1796606 RepID=UPI0022463C5A|nr:ankyrin repeat domain-containing protein [Cupriavidus nantongensis]
MLPVTLRVSHGIPCQFPTDQHQAPTPADFEALVALLKHRDDGAALERIQMQPALATSADADGQTALNIAAMAGCSSAVIETLVRAGAPLEAAATENLPKLMHKVLLNKDYHGDTALIRAARQGHRDAIVALIRAGSNLEAKGSYGYTALMEAAANGHRDAVIVLLGAGANIEAKSDCGATALICAADRGHLGTIDALLSAGANIEAKDNEGRTVLICAALSGHHNAVEALLEAGANLEAKDIEGATALMWAGGNNHRDVINSLAAAGANLDANDNDGNTALLLAACIGHRDAIAALVSAGANLEAKNNDGNTALIRAAILGYPDAIDDLLNAGADPEAKNNNGDTALIVAAYRGRAGLIDALLDARANIEAKNNGGHTALFAAATSTYDCDAIEALLRRGANIAEKNNRGETILVHAAAYGRRDAASALQVAYYIRGLSLSTEEQQALANAKMGPLTPRQMLSDLNRGYEHLKHERRAYLVELDRQRTEAARCDDSVISDGPESCPHSEAPRRSHFQRFMQVLHHFRAVPVRIRDHEDRSSLRENASIAPGTRNATVAPYPHPRFTEPRIKGIPAAERSIRYGCIHGVREGAEEQVECHHIPMLFRPRGP